MRYSFRAQYLVFYFRTEARSLQNQASRNFGAVKAVMSESASSLVTQLLS